MSFTSVLTLLASFFGGLPGTRCLASASVISELAMCGLLLYIQFFILHNTFQLVSVPVVTLCVDPFLVLSQPCLHTGTNVMKPFYFKVTANFTHYTILATLYV